VTAQPLVYVHGAGPQKTARDMKQELDLLLFGKDLGSSRVAHYADVRWPPPPQSPADNRLDRTPRGGPGAIGPFAWPSGRRSARRLLPPRS
jgi:hypothetical protein